MEYKVKITSYAIEQMQEIIAYISKVLRASDTARKWLAKLKREISKLDTMPNRFPLVDEEPWRKRDIHKMLVDNFIVYYWIDDVNHTV